MAKIFSLFGEIYVDNSSANKSIKETKDNAESSKNSLTKSLGSIAKNTVKIGTAIAGATTAVVGGLSSMAMSAAETAGAIDDGAKKVGTTAEEYQKWAYAAKLGGMEVSTLEQAMIKQQKAFADAKEGSSSMSEAYKRLGIDIGNISNSGDAFNEVIAKLADMEDETQRNAIANDIFGKSYAELTPLLKEGSEGIAAWKQEAEDLGAVMSSESVEAGANFGDTIDRIKTSLGGMFNQIASQLMPILDQVMKLVLDNMPLIQNIINALAPVLVSTLQQILPIFVDMVQQILPVILDLITQLLPIISEIIQAILPIFVQLITILLPPLMEIIQVLLPPLMQILNALLPLLQPILDLLVWAINTILMPIITVLSNIINLLSSGLVTAINFLIPIVKGVLKVFQDVFGQIFNVVKTPINFIIDGLNTFIKAINKIKIPDWVPGIGGKGLNIPTIKKLRIGMDYVPYDEMPALLHKGERVLTAEENKEFTNILKSNSQASDKQEQNNYYNNIVIEKMEVRDDKDIKKIAEELYYLFKKKEV